MSDSLWPNELQLSSLPCPSLLPGVCSNSCPLSWRCCLTISSSVNPFSSCPQSFPASGSFPVTQLFTSGDKIIGALVSASILPMSIQGWFSLGLTGLILQSKGASRVFSSTTIWKHQFFGTQHSLMVQLSHQYKTTGKTIVLIIQTFGKVMSLIFNTLFWFVIYVCTHLTY